MSDVGECLDHALVESFNGKMKRELIDHQSWDSHDEVFTAIAEYIAGWYNPFRYHSSLGYMSPVQYEISLTTQNPLPARACTLGSSPESS